MCSPVWQGILPDREKGFFFFKGFYFLKAGEHTPVLPYTDVWFLDEEDAVQMIGHD